MLLIQNRAKSIFILKRLTIALCLLGSSASLFAKGDYAEAFNLAKRYEKQADSLFLVQQYDSAIRVQLLADRLFQNLQSRKRAPDLIKYSALISNCRLLYFSSRRTHAKETLSKLRGLLASTNQRFGTSSREACMVNLYLTKAMISLDSTAQAHELVTENERILRNHFNPISEEMLEVYMALAKCELSLGTYSKSLEHFKQCAQIGIGIFGEDDYRMGIIHIFIGNAYNRLMKYSEAHESFYHAHEIFARCFNQDHPLIGKCLDRIGDTHLLLCQYQKALEFFNKASEIYIHSTPSFDIELAEVFRNMGDIYFILQQFDKAQFFKEKAYRMNTQILGNFLLQTARSIISLGNSLLAKKNHPEALKLFQQAVLINDSLFGSDHPWVACIYKEIGNLYMDIGELSDSAIAYYNKALNIYTQHDFIDNHIVAEILTNIARWFAKQKKNNEAAEYFTNALNIYLKICQEKHPYLSRTYNELANIELNLGHPRKSIVYFHLALKANFIRFNDPDPYNSIPIAEDCLDISVASQSIEGICHGFRSLAMTKTDPLQRDSLVHYLQSANRYFILFDSLYSNFISDVLFHEDALSISQKFHQMYMDAVENSLELFEVTGEERFFESAYYFSSTNNARLLLDYIIKPSDLTRLGIQDSLLQQEKQKRALLNHLLIQWHNESDTTQKAWINEEILRLNVELQRVEKRISALMPQAIIPKFGGIGSFSIQSISSVIPDSLTAIIDFSRSSGNLHIFIFTKQKYFHQSVQLTDFNLNQLIEGCLTGIRLFEDSKYISCASKLYQLLILPVESEIRHIQKLIIIPSEKLYQLPFEVLLTKMIKSNPKEPLNYKALPYLIKKYEISYSYSIRLLNQALKTLDEPVHQFLGFTPSIQLSNQKEFSSIRYSKDEIEEITSMLQKNSISATIFTDSEATENCLKSHAGRFDILHIASHSSFDTSFPISTFIQFSPADLPSTHDGNTADDGKLTISEILMLPMKGEHVVLSSCESGVGKLVSGEGSISLAWAFLAAGAQSVTYSLWKVWDKQTAELMKNYYSSIITSNHFSRSLRKAKLKMIANPKTAHPQFWGGFVLTGK